MGGGRQAWHQPSTLAVSLIGPEESCRQRRSAHGDKQRTPILCSALPLKAAEGEQLRTPLCPHTWQALARPIVTDGVGAAVVATGAAVVGVSIDGGLTAQGGWGQGVVHNAVAKACRAGLVFFFWGGGGGQGLLVQCNGRGRSRGRGRGRGREVPGRRDAAREPDGVVPSLSKESTPCCWCPCCCCRRGGASV